MFRMKNEKNLRKLDKLVIVMKLVFVAIELIKIEIFFTPSQN